MRLVRRTALLLALLALASPAAAQAPHEDWRTITTPRFRVHYPLPYEAWSLRAAERLESIRSAVEKEVGYRSDAVVDVVITNPIAAANGLAWPILDAPRIVFYVEPPGPEEQIGAYSTWIDLLAVHEVAHIVHMLRPSRNRVQRLAERFVLPLDPITLSAPRWVLEGYATVVEGRLTGAGRPPGTMRAMILRKWAVSGALPSYGQLDSDSRFFGMSMAYLAGSAYLEWLEQRTGPGSLQKLWARMTAREKRSFAAAFAGVFGDTPERLYGQFTSELTASALAVDRAAPLREGDLWQETDRGSGDPAVSPDGKRIAIVLRPRNAPAKLVVWPTGPAGEEERKYKERIEKMLKLDPEDVAPVRSKPLPRKPLYSWTPADGSDLATPRWMPDGQSLLFSHRQPDRDGFLHHDLFLWTPETNEARRVTHLADVEDADPLPDGRSAVAVRTRFGQSQLVIVDLATGAIEPLTTESLDSVYASPRSDRSGDRIAFIVNRGGVWSLMVRNRRTAAEHLVAGAPGVNVLSADWSRTAPDTFYATLDTRGYADVYRVAMDGTREPLTRSSGAALEPAPSADGRVFFMGLEPSGFVLRVIAGATAAAAPPPVYNAALVPALPPAAANAPRFTNEDVRPGKQYGIGRQETSWFAGEILAPQQHALEVGARFGDLVGRLDTLVIGSLASGGLPDGGAVISAWRGWPVTIAGHAFTADETMRRSGIEGRGSWTARFPLSRVTLEAGGLAGDPLHLAFVDAAYQLRQRAGGWRFDEGVRGAAEAGSLRHYRVSAGGSLRHGGFSLSGRYQYDVVNDPKHAYEQIEIGGARSSIVPASAMPTRIYDPALPAALITGTRYDGTRFEATIGIPVTIFYQLHRTNVQHFALAGAEVSFASDAMPLLRIPGLDLTAGVARMLDAPLRHETKLWLAMRWRP